MGPRLLATRGAWLIWCLAVAGCFSPGLDYPGGELPCGPGESCPPGYQCATGRCWVNGQVPSPDAPLVEVDAPVDAALDAPIDAAGEIADASPPDAPLSPDAAPDAPADASPDAATADAAPDGAADAAPDATADARPVDAAAADARIDAAVAPPVLEITPPSKSFGTVTVDDTSATQTFTVENTGQAAVTGLALSITGTDGAHFDIAAATCGTTLNGGSSCSADVVFAPAASGARSGSLRAAGTGTSATASLTGTGEATLSVSVSGTGSGSVTSTPPGIDCPGACAADFTSKTVTLSPDPAAGSSFAGWGGDCSGSAGCTVTLDAPAKSVSASFGPETHMLTVMKIGTGGGTVTSIPSGINCGTTCSKAFPAGNVSVSADPDTISAFRGFTGGGCSPPDPFCTINLTADTTVMADFAPAWTLMVHVDPASANRVRVTDSFGVGQNCFSICSYTFPEGEEVELRAMPDADWTFDFWYAGDCGGSSPVYDLTMDEDKVCRAQFSEVMP
jgi:hypothetical protein